MARLGEHVDTLRAGEGLLRLIDCPLTLTGSRFGKFFWPQCNQLNASLIELAQLPAPVSPHRLEAIFGRVGGRQQSNAGLWERFKTLGGSNSRVGRRQERGEERSEQFLMQSASSSGPPQWITQAFSGLSETSYPIYQ
jgi:hypothetical protein